MDEPLVTWKCPKCPFQTKQPSGVLEATHLCGTGKRFTHLVKQKPPEPDGWDLI